MTLWTPSGSATCLACGATTDAATPRCRMPTPEGNHVDYTCCSSCGLMRLDPMPGPNEWASLYDDDYYGCGRTKFCSCIERFRDLCMSHRARRVYAMLPRPSGCVLDIGCGDGRFLDGMRKRGFAIVGVELEGPAFDRAACVPGIQLFKGDVTQMAWAGHDFEAITLWHVLEHMTDPLATLERCRGLLQSDGILVVETPNLNSLQSRMVGNLGFHLDPPRHVFQFTETALASILHRAGFEIVKRETGSMEMGIFGAAQSWLNRLVKPRNLLFDMLRSRNRCHGETGAKLASVILGTLLVPCAVIFTGFETSIGSGPVLRYFCRGK